ncbi:response regulator receiver protein [Gloeomargarita lithophora Alchichica-D10]|uniref:Response regulator receiver protein n=1 Tax=Gloeomargarita lithophora Alchichica-D10 TaxID=1188229 RepID=A0A1J0A8X7_9CYAN|nr:response regulator [Gloeomargarita lithophora]APB32392.1 response regulator receiver protein [Gloeomargarita lithophora Alchichica-D10]
MASLPRLVLVVEDVMAEQKLMLALLQRSGYKAVGHGSAEAAWDWLGSYELPALVVADIGLPGESGLDLCRRIRAHPDWHDLPVVMCSCRDREADRFWAQKQGATDYLTKPYTPQQLLKVVQKYVT